LDSHAAPGDIPAFSDPPDVAASSIKDQAAQFADLHNRLQAMMKHISSLSRDLTQAQTTSTNAFNNFASDVKRLESQLSKLDYLAAMDKKLDSIQNDVRQTKADLHNALDRHVAGLRNEVRDNHGRVLEGLRRMRRALWAIFWWCWGVRGYLSWRMFCIRGGRRMGRRSTCEYRGRGCIIGWGNKFGVCFMEFV